MLRKPDDFRMKPFLAIDAGAANLKVALFDPQSNGTLTLARYEVVSLGQRGSPAHDWAHPPPATAHDEAIAQLLGWRRVA